MATKNQNNNQNNKKKPQIQFRPVNIGMWVYGLVFLLIIGWAWFGNTETPATTNWNQVEQMITAGDVESINVINKEQANVSLKNAAVEKYRAQEQYKSIPQRGVQFVFNIGSVDTFRSDLDKIEEQTGQPVTLTYENKRNFWMEIIGFLPIVLILVFFFIMMRNASRNAGGGGQGGVFSVGKAKAQVFDKNNVDKITFKDVAGLEEAKVEIMEIVDFLRNPQKYKDLGGKIPKGALLVGPPGTGKTLLAKAVAGEADVPFFTMSGSDFVEMFVGVGASRVRDLFRQAKEKAPCIVFIDEIDAVGRARSKNVGFSSNDERENTLNQLLTEMDGFGTNSGVILLAATNRADILDKALLRAGRFDRQIEVGLPDVKERAEIFDVHLRNIKLDPNLDREFLAKQTPGFSGADIANVCNEAALIAARYNKKFVQKDDFLNAVDRIVGGLERKNIIMTPEEKRLIAYHEAGHATVSWILEHANPLIKVTIIPRGNALGAAWYLPEERKVTTREQMMDDIASALGGRAAEQLIFNTLGSGALSDLEGSTKRAYSMVAYLGMSDKVGNMSYYDSSGRSEMSFNNPYSEETAQLIDKEVKRIMDDAFDIATKVLKENMVGFTQLAELLLEKEVVFTEDLERIFGKRIKDIKLEKAEAAKKLADAAKVSEVTSVDTTDAPANSVAESASDDSSTVEIDVVNAVKPDATKEE